MAATYHGAKCLQVRHAIAEILNQDLASANCESRFLKIASAISATFSGKGAGLSAGHWYESVFKDMLNCGDSRFVPVPADGVTDADYYFEDYPLSHKTLSYRNTRADLALSWSKNGAKGLRRTTFESSIVLLNLRKPSSRGVWRRTPQGIYVIPLDQLASRVVLAENNKSDSIIPATSVLALMQWCLTHSLVVPISMVWHPDHNVGRIRPWYQGISPAAPPLTF